MYKSSGLAEIVKDPSPITLEYLNEWFSGSGAFGKALSILGWPISSDNSPLLVWNIKDGLRMDLDVEEKVMYSKTIFHYVKKNDDYVLSVDFKKIFLPNKILGTLRAIWSQSKLLISHQRTYDLAKSYVELIPLDIPETKDEIEKIISEKMWPMIIAVDYMGEFVYSALTNNLSSIQKSELIQKLHARTSPNDWYTKSMLAWSQLHDKEMSEKEFLLNYGYASGNDYELTQPRYYELLKQPKPAVGEIKIENMKVDNLEDLYVGLQYLRSEAKRRSLVWIAALREVI